MRTATRWVIVGISGERASERNKCVCIAVHRRRTAEEVTTQKRPRTTRCQAPRRRDLSLMSNPNWMYRMLCVPVWVNEFSCIKTLARHVLINASVLGFGWWRATTTTTPVESGCAQSAGNNAWPDSLSCLSNSTLHDDRIPTREIQFLSGS